jgi:predicted  nucleic acid-binding Zn-ribbon protein
MKAKLAVIGVGIIALVAATAGQSPSSSDPLLAEVRALRTELNQAAGTSIRTQLLVARLQLQEQRITVIGKQLSDVQMLRTGNDAGVAQMSARSAQLEESLRSSSTSAETRQQFEREIAGMKVPLGQMRQRSQELSAQENALSSQLVGEQSRWTDFNSRLDEIEKEIREKR